MRFVVIFLGLVVLIVAAFAIPKFVGVLWRVLFVGAGVVILLAIIVRTGRYLDNRKFEHEQELARTRIAAGELELMDFRLAPSHDRQFFQLVGRIRNKSQKYTLIGLELRIVIQDCSASDSCETVGDETADFSMINIPPGQLRQVEEGVNFPGLPPLRGRMQWNYSVTETKGDAASP